MDWIKLFRLIYAFRNKIRSFTILMVKSNTLFIQKYVEENRSIILNHIKKRKFIEKII